MDTNNEFNKLMSFNQEELNQIFQQMSLTDIDDLLTAVREVEDND